MKSQLVTAPVRHEHPPQRGPSPTSRSTRRVGPLDRVALHLGVALIKWGRRRSRVAPLVTPTAVAEAFEARREMERVLAEHAANLPRFR